LILHQDEPIYKKGNISFVISNISLTIGMIPI
jgi:hypothetical protein